MKEYFGSQAVIQNNEVDLNRYFAPQGATDKRTDELKEQVLKKQTRSDGEPGKTYTGLRAGRI